MMAHLFVEYIIILARKETFQTENVHGDGDNEAQYIEGK
jgi:hypothetical protein